MSQDVLKTILYIEDDIGLGRLLQKRMQLKDINVAIATTGAEGLELLKTKSYDLVLLDNFLPDMTGIDILGELTPVDQYPPIILLTASGDERLAVQALEKGAADYAVKDPEQFYIDLLPAVMHAAYTRYRLISENEQQKRDLEMAWQKAESGSQAKSEFLATMSHEIRTPLNVISGIGALLNKSVQDEKQREMVDVLNSNAAMLLGLVNDILDISRIEAGQISLDNTPFTISHVLDNIQMMFGMDAQRKGLVLSITDETQDRQWFGDVARMQQILMNLVSNAIKFTERGQITVIAKTVTKDALPVLSIDVEDTGIGIPAEKIGIIFSKFVQADQSITRRFGGSGLGLALSQSFARLMGGEITVKSQEKIGSLFNLQLPLDSFITMTHSSDKQEQLTKPAQGSSQHILLVEDYPANILIATMMLENMNYTVDVVSNGQDAVQKIEQAMQPYYAVLMDIQMQGMDGFEATRLIRALEAGRDYRHVIIGATAHALVGDRERCIDAGMDDYISKPIDWALMEQKLAAVKKQEI